ncbi:keto-hydroxyglutarate-aldolase/keto-deoxy-phosphogluconate aldolase [compost metagenome]
MVTGGVDKENINQWLENGAEALGIGSLLTKDTDLQHDAIVCNAKEFLEKVK